MDERPLSDYYRPTGSGTAFGGPALPDTAEAVNRLPTLCLVVFVLELVFSGLRGCVLPLSMLGAAVVQADDPLAPTIVFEIATGVGMVVLGLATGVGGLLKQGWAATAGWIKTPFTLASIGVGLWQSMLTSAQDVPPEVRAGMLVGAMFALGVRVGLLGLFVAGLLQYGHWWRARFGQPA